MWSGHKQLVELFFSFWHLLCCLLKNSDLNDFCNMTYFQCRVEWDIQYKYCSLYEWIIIMITIRFM